MLLCGPCNSRQGSKRERSRGCAPTTKTGSSTGPPPNRPSPPLGPLPVSAPGRRRAWPATMRPTPGPPGGLADDVEAGESCAPSSRRAASYGSRCVDDDFDVVVLFSGDSDLLPALERAASASVACETAAWAAGGRRLPTKPYITWEHRLRRHDYDQAHDSFDYR